MRRVSSHGRLHGAIIHSAFVNCIVLQLIKSLTNLLNSRHGYNQPVAQGTIAKVQETNSTTAAVHRAYLCKLFKNILGLISFFQIIKLAISFAILRACPAYSAACFHAYLIIGNYIIYSPPDSNRALPYSFITRDKIQQGLLHRFRTIFHDS